MRRALVAAALLLSGGAAAFVWWREPQQVTIPTATARDERPSVALSNVRVAGDLDDEFSWALDARAASADEATQTVTLDGVTRAELHQHGQPLLRVTTARLTTNRLTRDVTTDAPVRAETTDGSFSLECAGFRWTARARRLEFAGPVLVTLHDTVLRADALTWAVGDRELTAGGGVDLAGAWGHARAAEFTLHLREERFVLAGPIQGALVWPAGSRQVAAMPSVPESLRTLLLAGEGRR